MDVSRLFWAPRRRREGYIHEDQLSYYGSFTTKQKVYTALHFYATGSFQMSVGDGEGASQATVHHIIAQVTNCLAKHADDVIIYVNAKKSKI